MSHAGASPAQNAPRFRALAKQHLVTAFGEPEVLPTSTGDLYRWVLDRRGGMNAHVYVTLDSPEFPDIAHVLISDPGARTVERVASITMRTIQEVDALIARIKAQIAED